MPLKCNVWFEDAETCGPHSNIEIYEGSVWGTARSTAKRGQIEEVSTRSVFRVDEGKEVKLYFRAAVPVLLRDGLTTDLG